MTLFPGNWYLLWISVYLHYQLNTLNQSHCRVYHPQWQQCSPECHRVPAVTRCWGYHGSIQDWGQVSTTVRLFWSHRIAWGRAGEETVRALSWQGEPLWWWHVKWHTHCICMYTRACAHSRAHTCTHTHNRHITYTAPHTHTNTHTVTQHTHIIIIILLFFSHSLHPSRHPLQNNFHWRNILR